MLRKTIHDATALPQSRPRADKVQRRGHMADLSWQRAGTWRTKSGHMVDTHEADTRSSQGLEARPKRIRGGHMADIWRTRFGGGHKADTWQTQAGHVADTRRTHGGQMARKADSRDTRRTHG